MLTSDNIQHALLFKRRMEISRFEAKLNGIRKQEKKALILNDHHKNDFLQQSKLKRKEWWKADKSFREMIQKNGESRLSCQPSSVLNSNNQILQQIKPAKNLNNLNINQSIDICAKMNLVEDTKPVRNSTPSQKVTFVRINSGGSSANLMKSFVEPSPIFNLEEKTDILLPIISVSSRINSSISLTKKSKSFQLKKEKSNDDYEQTFKRFLNNSPFIIENKNIIKKIELQKLFFNREIKVNKLAAAKKDKRFDNLINSLNTIS